MVGIDPIIVLLQNILTIYLSESASLEVVVVAEVLNLDRR